MPRYNCDSGDFGSEDFFEWIECQDEAFALALGDVKLIDEFERFVDPCDIRSEILCAMLSVCDVLFDKKVPIPSEWGYKRGLTSNIDDFWYGEMIEGRTNEEILEFGNELNFRFNELIARELSQ